MNITVFGATGSVGSECVAQCLEANHDVTVLVRTLSKLPGELRDRVSLVEGDGLDAEAVARALGNETEGILFAIGPGSTPTAVFPGSASPTALTR